MDAEWKSGPACDATRLLRRRLSVTRLLSLAPAYASIPRSGTCLVFGVCCHVRGAAVRTENGFMRAMSGRTSLAGPAGPGPLPGVSRGVTGCRGVSRGVTGSALHTGASEPGGSFGRVAEGQGPLSRHQEPASAVRVSVGLGSSARQALEQSCVRIPPLPLASCALVGRLPRLLGSAPYRHFQASVNSGKIREWALMICISSLFAGRRYNPGHCYTKTNSA